MIWTAITILAVVNVITLVLLYRHKRELAEKTFLFWEEKDGYKVLKNSNGDEITRL